MEMSDLEDALFWRTKAVAAEAEVKAQTNEYIETLFNQSVRYEKIIAEAHFLLSLFSEYEGVKPWLEAHQKTAEAMSITRKNADSIREAIDDEIRGRLILGGQTPETAKPNG